MRCLNFYTTLNVVFDGYNVYEISNKIEHQYIELTWINNYVNANPNLLKQFFSVKEKIKAFKVRKNSILEKSKTNYEIKKMIDDRQKHLLFMAAEDMVVNGLGGGKIQIISSGYDLNTAKRYLQETYNKIVLPAKYGQETQTSGGGFFERTKAQLQMLTLQDYYVMLPWKRCYASPNGYGISIMIRDLRSRLQKKLLMPLHVL